MGPEDAIRRVVGQWQILGAHSEHDPNCSGGPDDCARLCPVHVQHLVTNDEAVRALLDALGVAGVVEEIVAARVTAARAEERERIAMELATVEEFAKDIGWETGEVLVPRDVTVAIARGEHR